jgi:hypothetical protein
MNLDILNIDAALIGKVKTEIECLTPEERKELEVAIRKMGNVLCGPEDILAPVITSIMQLHDADPHSPFSKLAATIGVSLALGVAFGLFYSERLRQKVN